LIELIGVNASLRGRACLFVFLGSLDDRGFAAGGILA
jgi:hypothetical protein